MIINNRIIDYQLACESHCARGPFLDGFSLADVPEFERWARKERERVAALVNTARQRLHAEPPNLQIGIETSPVYSSAPTSPPSSSAEQRDEGRADIVIPAARPPHTGVAAPAFRVHDT